MPRIGQIEYEIVSDGTTWVDGGGAFGLVPRSSWAKRIPPDEENRIPMPLHCLLLWSGGKTILIDTGLGPDVSDRMEMIYRLRRPEGTLLDGLDRLGLGPDDVDLVVNTHLHADHSGGNTRLRDENWVPTFPQAEYWVQRLELADAMYPNERTRATYFRENFEPLLEAGQLRIIDGDTSITPQLKAVILRGHTRAHQGILIESEGESGLFVADMASFSHHFERLAWVSAYDVEPLENIETKRRWQAWALRTRATLIFQHDPEVRIARLVERDDRLVIERLG